MTALRALVVLPAVPALEGGAAGRCALALVDGLRGHGVDVTALAARTPGDRAQAPDGAGVRVVDVPGASSRMAANAHRLLRPRGDLTWGSYADEVRQASMSTDVVHLEQVEGGALARGLAAPSVVHLHNLVRADRDLGSPLSAGFREVVEFAAGERAAVRRSRWVLASSPVVRDAVRRWAPGVRIAEAPLSLLPEHYPPALLDGPPVIGIVGTGGWVPTARAIDRLVHRVWPQVLRRVPDARLRVAGRGTLDLPCLRTPTPGVEAVGEVASAPAFLASLSALAYPLDRGSGMKVKVLESLASGLPVVTTACGAEGLLAEGGMVVSEDDAEIAHALAELLTDGAARREQGGAAREHFDRHYAPGPATEPVAALYEEMAGRS